MNNDKDKTGRNNTKLYDFEITWVTSVDIFDMIIFFVLLCVVLLLGIAAVIVIHFIGALTIDDNEQDIIFISSLKVMTLNKTSYSSVHQQ